MKNDIPYAERTGTSLCRKCNNKYPTTSGGKKGYCFDCKKELLMEVEQFKMERKIFAGLLKSDKVLQEIIYKRALCAVQEEVAFMKREHEKQVIVNKAFEVQRK